MAGRLARELAKRCFQVTWLATSASPAPEVDENCPVRAVGVEAWNATERHLGVPYPVLGLSGMRRLIEEVRAAEAVILHDSLYVTSIVTFLAAKALERPLLVVQHIGEVPYRNWALRGLMAMANRCLARTLLASAQQVVFISEVVHAFFHGVRFRRTPIVIFNGVDTGIFRPASNNEKRLARHRFDLPQSAPVALFVGRFVEKKGLRLIRSVAALRPAITWVLAGWGVLDPEAWRLPNVRVIRSLSGEDLAQLYRSSDLFVLPSQGEGFPLVIQEALACGLPVVCGAESATADAAAAPFLLGVDLEVGDGDEVANRLAGAVDHVVGGVDHDDARRRFDFVQTRYSWTLAADRYADVLGDLIAEGA